MLVRKSVIHLNSEWLSPRVLSLETSLEGMMVLKAELKSINNILTSSGVHSIQVVECGMERHVFVRFVCVVGILLLIESARKAVLNIG